jgi:hypothetical protein
MSDKTARVRERRGRTDEDMFRKVTTAAKQVCWVSEAFASVPEITLNAVLRE